MKKVIIELVLQESGESVIVMDSTVTIDGKSGFMSYSKVSPPVLYDAAITEEYRVQEFKLEILEKVK
jgi:hypothetical protein